jgi:hypothetical protein
MKKFAVMLNNNLRVQNKESAARWRSYYWHSIAL